MFNFDQLDRRVSVSHRAGRTRIFIRRRNDWEKYVWQFAISTVACASLLFTFWSRFGRSYSSPEIFYFLLLAGIVMLAFCIATLIAIWGAFGTEEIVVLNGTLHWTRNALWLKRDFHTALSDIKDVSAKTRFGIDNWVQITCKSGIYEIGQAILASEASEIEHALWRCVPR
jgi:hypothetical protein